MSCVPRIVENVLRKGSWDYQRWFLTSDSEWGCVEAETVKKLWHKIKLWLNLIDRCACHCSGYLQVCWENCRIHKFAGQVHHFFLSPIQSLVLTGYISESKFVLFLQKWWFQSEYFPTPDWICLGMWRKRVRRISNCEVTFKCDEYVQDMRLR